MHTIRKTAYRGVVACMVFLLSGMAPMPVLAHDAMPDTTDTANATDTGNLTENDTAADGAPTGAASWTYHFNSETGLWENDYYTYSPATKITLPKTPLEYTYNSTTNQWDTQVWQYSAAASAYQQVPVSVATPPAGAVTHGGPTATELSEITATGPESTESNTSSASQSVSHAEGQPESSATYPSDHGTGAETQLQFNNRGTVTNTGSGVAATGDVSATANTTVGDVASGNATNVANYINLLQSQSGLGAAGMATFTTTIQGDVHGDFLIDPANFTQQPAAPGQNIGNLTVTSSEDANITNTINLHSQSGTATADANTSAGSVSTGDAHAIADVVNMINSVVAANQSFLGVINIEGNYSGNILVPTDSLNAILGSSASDPNLPSSTTIDAQTANTQHIANTTNLSAATGAVTASQNTLAGDAASGNALTNLTVLNLTGRKVVADNSLLVFVNVLGSWVGLIMDAPAGTTYAALGGGVVHDASSLPENSTISSDTTSRIQNNITATAKSGDAAATRNTQVGNITSGDASASANIANITNSNFSLGNWFGVLFINVFGTWRGNFGAAKPAVAPITSGMSGPDSGPMDTPAQPRVFAFVPTDENDASARDDAANVPLSPLSQANQANTVRSEDMLHNVSRVLGASTQARMAPQSANSDVTNKVWSAIAIALGLSGLGLVGVDRVRTNLGTKTRQQK